MSRLTRWLGIETVEAERALDHLPWWDNPEYAFKFGGLWYNGFSTTMQGSVEEAPVGFEGTIHGIHRRSGVVAAAVAARALVISDIHFRFQDIETGELDPDPIPELEGSAQALHKAEVSASYAGNAYIWVDRAGGRLVPLRPDWVRIVAVSEQYPGNPLQAPDARIFMYGYQPSGPDSEPLFLPPEDVIHWAPEPSALSTFIGESWVTSVVREALVDLQTVKHVEQFFEKAATPNTVYSMDKDVDPDSVSMFIEKFRENYEGAVNAFKTMFIGGGASVQVIGSKLSELNMRELQGGFENRVATRSRVPSSVLGIREGNQSGALQATAYAQMRRLWADGWFHPTARGLCQAVGRAIPAPEGKRVWYDAKRTLLLLEDALERAQVMSTQIGSIGAAIQAGFKPEAAVQAVMNDSLFQLAAPGAHTQLVSVQLLPPGEANSANTAGRPPEGGDDDDDDADEAD